MLDLSSERGMFGLFVQTLLADVSLGLVILVLAPLPPGLDLRGPRRKSSSSTSPSPTTTASHVIAVFIRAYSPTVHPEQSPPTQQSASAIPSGPRCALTSPALAKPDEESLIP